MNKDFDDSPAANAVRISYLQMGLDKISEILQGVQTNHNELVRLVGLQQQIQQQHADHIQELQKDVFSLKESRTELIGGWKAVVLGGAIIVAASGIAGAAASILAAKYENSVNRQNHTNAEPHSATAIPHLARETTVDDPEQAAIQN